VLEIKKLFSGYEALSGAAKAGSMMYPLNLLSKAVPIPIKFLDFVIFSRLNLNLATSVTELKICLTSTTKLLLRQKRGQLREKAVWQKLILQSPSGYKVFFESDFATHSAFVLTQYFVLGRQRSFNSRQLPQIRFRGKNTTQWQRNFNDF